MGATAIFCTTICVRLVGGGVLLLGDDDENHFIFRYRFGKEVLRNSFLTMGLSIGVVTGGSTKKYRPSKMDSKNSEVCTRYPFVVFFSEIDIGLLQCGSS
uniref:Uncharacterized protein n=1 Tax=Proboscia inermis TaxID=420281 RepID=A0A7S0CEV5_9STRA